MPLMNEFKSGSTSRSSGGGGNQLWRNKVRLRKVDEYAIIRFISPFGNVDNIQPNLLADESWFYYQSSKTAQGQNFTNYIYCADLNKTAEGNIVQKSDCECRQTSPDTPPCYVDGEPAVDGWKSPAKLRYHYWILHYYTMHLGPNPILDTNSDVYDAPWAQSQRESGEAVAWDQVKMGNKTYYRESVMKPQILEMARPTRETLKSYAERHGDITNRTYEYIKTQADGGFINYIFMPSDMEVPKFGRERTMAVLSTLPRLDRISAKLVDGIDIEPFGSIDKQADKKAVEGAVEDIESEAEVQKEEPVKKKEKKQPVAVNGEDTVDDAFSSLANFDDETDF